MNPERDAIEQRLRPLWLAAQAGDAAAYAQALEVMAQRLRGYCRRRLVDAPHEVEDVVQECLLAVHLQRATFDATMPVTAWLHGIARYKLIDHWRRTGRRGRATTSLDDLAEDEQPLAADDAAEPLRDLALLLERLPAAMRRSIVDTKIEGLSVAEAARTAGVSESAVKVNVHRGLQKLARFVRGES